MVTSGPFRRHRRNVSVAAALAFAAGQSAAAEVAPAGDEPAGHVVFAMPIDFARKTSGFATRRHPIRKTLHFHAGVDFAAPYGTPVRSVAEGWVEFAGIRNGYGKVVQIRHGDGGRSTVYAHLSRIDVATGRHVAQGETIGAVGSSGLATGPHLHFEVRENGKPVDPLQLAYRPAVDIAARTGTATLATSPAQCLELLQKASLEALDPNELDLLRKGCIQ